MGPPGPQGPPGEDGENGDNGTDGEDGVNGEGIVGFYWWDNMSGPPVPGDDYTVSLPNWQGIEPGQWYVFSAWASTIVLDTGAEGLLELPFLIQRGNYAYQASALFDPNTGQFHLSYLDGWYVLAQVVVFTMP
jgi:hypothetical protein